MATHPTIEGVSVSASQLGAVYDYARANSERLIKMEADVSDIKANMGQMVSSTATLADIARARREEELQDRQVRLERDAATAAERSKAWGKLAEWWTANWKLVIGLLMLLLWPQGVQYLQAVGVLPTPQVVAPAPDPIVVPVPVEARRDREADQAEARPAGDQLPIDGQEAGAPSAPAP